MNTQTNKPTQTIRDGAIKATIWPNMSDKGLFYTVEFSRTYTDEAGNVHSAGSFSGTQLLQVARLAERAYDRIGELRVEAKSAKQAA